MTEMCPRGASNLVVKYVDRLTWPEVIIGYNGCVDFICLSVAIVKVIETPHSTMNPFSSVKIA